MSANSKSPHRRPGFLVRFFSTKELGILLILVFMVAGVSWLTPSFSTRSNAVSILQAIAPIAIMAIGQTLVILTAGIDLSVGSVCALSSYAMAMALVSPSDYPLWVGIAAALGTGSLCGFLNGFIITKLRVTPFIVTLGMLSACSGLTLGLSGGKQVGLNSFGAEQVVEKSFLETEGALPGKPEVERRTYADCEEVTALLTSGDSIWLAGSSPALLQRLNPEWEVLGTTSFEETELTTMVPYGQGSVLVAGGPGGKVWKVTDQGEKSLLCELAAGRVLALAAPPGGKVWCLAGDPSGLWTISEAGTATQVSNLPIEGTPTAFCADPQGEVFVSTSDPGRLLRFDPLTGPVTLYESSHRTVSGLRAGQGGEVFFFEGSPEPDRLTGYREGESRLIWETPKPPLRDYLAFPGDRFVVSTGNMGAVYLLRSATDTLQLHPMTRFKSRVLGFYRGDRDVILVGNSGPGGLTTMSVSSTESTYPKAAAFNGLFLFAPWAMGVLFLTAWFFLRYTTWGTYLYAIGGNELAARLSGIHVDRMKILCYVTTGFLAGLAGIFLTSKLHTLDPNLAKGYELKVIAAVVIGGTSLMGGQGSIWGTLIGACLLFVLNYALVHLGMEDIWSDLFVGVVIILAAILDSSRSQFAGWMASFRRFRAKP